MFADKDAERIAYYRQQASACAAAALTTAIAEIRHAYRNLEEGWLSLAPKAKEGLDRSCSDAETRSVSNAEPGKASNEDPVAEVNRQNEKTIHGRDPNDPVGNEQSDTRIKGKAVRGRPDRHQRNPR
jgi:hypothetical protein